MIDHEALQASVIQVIAGVLAEMSPGEAIDDYSEDFEFISTSSTFLYRAFNDSRPNKLMLACHALPDPVLERTTPPPKS